MAMRKLKPVEANDGSYGGKVLSVFDEMSAQADAKELRELALSLAYEQATRLIEGMCLNVGDDFFDTTSCAQRFGDSISDCIRFLELRGLIEYSIVNATWVRFRDESEATA